MSELQPRRRSVGAWVAFDIANTTFWTGVVGLAFPLWITNELSGDDASLGYTLAATMAVVLVLAPILGAISDQLGRRIPLLVVTSLVCVGATLLLGSGGLFISLGIFALALGAMELGTIFYNSLLTEVSTEANRGRIAGLGIGIGSLGAFIAVVVALLFSEPKGHTFVFHIVALLFLIFSFPIFVLLKERSRLVHHSSPLGKVRLAFAQVKGNLRSLHRFPGLRRFLLAKFLYTIAITTAAAFAVVYASQTIGFSDTEIQLVLLAGISLAIPSAVFWGIMVDRIGPRPVLVITLLMWIGLLLSAVAIPWLSLNSDLWWAVGCLIGVAMPGVFTADRPNMLTFAPPQYLGEFFGLHAMVGKSGRVVGPFMWGLISTTLGFGQPAAALSLIGCLAVSCVILGRMSAPAASPSPGLAE